MSVTARHLLARWFGGPSAITTAALKKWNIIIAGLLAIQAMAVLLLSGGRTVPVYVSYLTSDDLQSKLHQTTVLAPGIHELLQVNLAYLVAAMLLISAVAYVVIATVWRVRYESWLKQNWQPLRWLMLIIAGSLMLVSLALIAGVYQLETLKAFVAFMAVAGLGALQLELQDKKGKPPLWAWIGASMTLFAAAMPWLIILVALVSTNLFGSTPVPSYVWWIYGATLFGWLLFVADAHSYRFRHGKWGNYLHAEAYASGVIFLTETVFTWLVFAAVLKP